MLNITDGGTVSNTAGDLGYNSTGSGQVTVSGVGSTWTNSDVLRVAYSGTGLLSIADGGKVSNAAGYLGYQSSGSGQVTVSGAGSTWTNSSHLTVGIHGDGSLSITNGGSVSTNSYAYLGEYTGSSGEVTVSGAGSTWTSSSTLYVGGIGEGSLAVTGGGAVSNVNGLIGLDTGSSGDVTVSGSGSTWTNSGYLRVGDYGTGSLAVTDGGKVSNTEGYLGYSSAGSGQATVSGAGSTWTNAGELQVGRQGTGTLTVADGAYVRTDGDLKVASESGSTGTVNLEGGTLSADAIAAPVGTDTFNWTGGTLKVTGTGGLALSSTGLLGSNVNLSPGKALNVAKTTTVGSGVTLNLSGGSFFTNDLTVNGTARLRSGDATIGNTFIIGYTGEMEIDGQDLALVTAPTISVGSELTMSDTTISAPSLMIPGFTTLNFDSGLLSIDGTVTCYGTARMGTVGAATIRAGALTNSGAILGKGVIDAPVTNTGNIAFSGDSSFNEDVTNTFGGKIIISGASAVTFFEDVMDNVGCEIRVSQGCTATYFGDLGGSGAFTGTGTSYIEGDMRPGASPGTTHFEGDVVFGFSAALEAELGADANDLLDVDGDLTLDGTLDVVLYGAFMPGTGDKFNILDWGTLDGTFHTVNLPGLSGGLLWDTSNLYLTGELAVTGEVVPEPSTLALIALGGLALVRRRRK
ncbi:MAG TPA: PEP-CTERM sorting domain-containing protein [Planctomycetota bacterium]|nr:PEP-CTERM sorting domain-containing protein [Planctomycetota bacterium]